MEPPVERIADTAEVALAVARAPFEVAATLDDFGETPATDQTERAHWVLRRPA